LVLALVALALHLGGGREPDSGATSAIPDLQPLAGRIDALETEIERMRGVVEELRLTPAALPEREPASVVAPGIDELTRRVEDLERRPHARLDGQGRVIPTEAEQAELDRLYSTEDDLQRAIARAEDPTATEAERLQALRLLRGQRDAAGLDARLHVLDSMLELARTSQEGEVRADVWRQLSHVIDRRLRQPLLDTLAYDEHADAREEAAETLEDFLPDVGVEAALRLAAENDADGGVRRQAASSLAGKR
jgi:hypothetical protein